MMDDAEVAIVALGTTIETARFAAEELRKEGIKAGVVAPRAFRPFPFNEIREALSNVKAVTILDRSAPMGALGALHNEIAAALYLSENRPVINGYIYGLGGRDFSVEEAKRIFKEAKANADAGHLTVPVQQFSGVRGPKLGFYETKRGK